MFNPAYSENARPEGFGILEVVGDGDGHPLGFVPLKQTVLSGAVEGPLALLRLTQTFGYSHAQSSRTLESAYRFPLPGDAAVTTVVVRFGETEIRALLRERGRAEAMYESAKKEARPVALLTRESPNVFTLQVAGIMPDQDVTVETGYFQLARPEGAGWSLRVPLTTAPRFVREDEDGSRFARGQPLALLRDPGHRFRLDLRLRADESIESPTHALAVESAGSEGESMRVRLRDVEVVPDRDLVLVWRPEPYRERVMLRVTTDHDPASGFVYFLALVIPPGGFDPAREVPREVILLVDHSGSMVGAKWRSADWAIERFLSGILGRDAFALAVFHTSTHWFREAVSRAEPGEVADAVAFLKARTDSGGTNLGVALEQALHLPRAEGRYARHVLVVTDAEVSDAGRVLRLVDEESGRPDRRRVSLLCIDAAPNAFLAQELADRSSGTARFLTSDPEDEDITTALDRVLDDWSAPVVSGLRLEVDRPEAQGAGRRSAGSGQAGWSVIDLGDLPTGRPVWVVGRAPRGEAGELTFRLTTAQSPEPLASCRVAPFREGALTAVIRAFFGTRQVNGLEYLIHSGLTGKELRDALLRLGYNPDRLPAPAGSPAPKVYAENAQRDAAETLRDLLTREALGYGLASSETAFIAERTESGRPVEGYVKIANALPAGWSDDFLLGAGAPRAVLPSSPPQVAVAGSVDPVMIAPVSPARPGARAYEALSQSLPTLVAKGLEAREAGSSIVFSGTPVFSDGEAILFDASHDQVAGLPPGPVTFERLTLRFPDGALTPREIGPEVTLLIFVNDLATPRASIRLTDLIHQRGERPLNLLKRPGQQVKIVLADPAGHWARSAPRIEIALGWLIGRPYTQAR